MVLHASFINRLVLHLPRQAPIQFLYSASLSPLRSTSFAASGRSAAPAACSQPNRYLSTMRYGLALLFATLTMYVTSTALVGSNVAAKSASSSDNASNSKYVSAFCAVPNETVANSIADTIVTEKLVACVNMIPGIKSAYWWKGEVVKDQEILLLMKTKRQLVSELNEKLRELHPYDVHELVIQPIIDGNAPFLDWIGESTKLKASD